MTVFCLGIGLLAAAALFFLASMTIPGVVCCGAGGVLVGAMLESG